MSADHGSTHTDLANLEFSELEMRTMLDSVASRALDEVARARDIPIRGDVRAEALCRAMRESPPRDPIPLELLLDQLFTTSIPRSFTTTGPGYLAYIPGGGVFPAALADFIADTTNRYTGIWQAAPALVQLEANALDWLRLWMDFPPSAAGLFTTGGSMANFNAIVCARERWLGTDLRDGVLYTSDQVHHSVLKSARLAGVLPDRVRLLPVDQSFRMIPDALTERVAADRRDGLKPFMVVTTAGTTNTGAVDPLDAIADLCEAEELWHHVDGAYGAVFYACKELRPILAGLPRADSLTLDPHKGLFLPYGTGALFVRNGAHLRAAHSAAASYLPEITSEFYDPSQHGPELSRGFPGLRVWLSMQVYGTRRYEAAIAEKRQLALEAAERCSAIPGLVIDAPPQLSLFAFHIEWPGATRADQDEATRELLERVTNRGRVMLTGCWAGGRFLGRVCILSYRTRRQHVDVAVRHMAEETARILERRR
jgi:aromatic-L-amino-acid/L-tryptophan decarboxylase